MLISLFYLDSGDCFQQDGGLPMKRSLVGDKELNLLKVDG